MERRRDPRVRRRLTVRYWCRGEEKPRPGHTLNVSGGGLFIGTDRPPRSGSRVRVEVVDPEQGFVVEGVVTHSHQVARELQQLHPSGMGVRFLRHEELMATLGLRAGRRQAGGGEAAPPGGFGVGPFAAAGEGPEPTGPRDAARSAPRPRPPVRASAEFSRPASGGVTSGISQTGGRPLAAQGVIPIRFRSVDDLRGVYQRDIRHGGLFITTVTPAQLEEIVSLELHLPRVAEPLSIPARVVHRVPPDTPGRSPGIGVQFVDPDHVLSRLRSLVTGLDR